MIRNFEVEPLLPFLARDHLLGPWQRIDGKPPGPFGNSWCEATLRAVLAVRLFGSPRAN